MSRRNPEPEAAQQLEKARTRRGFERAADTYDAAAVLQREIGTRLLERLDYMRLEPERVLDLGCGTGFVTEKLLSRYKKAEVIGLDMAPAMVARTRLRGRWLRRPLGVCADV
ncbi:MAG: methyltransferase domain-containing protein, partial [Thiothrix sp.]|nr:methyltransferase domain-containing protein [Thiothrix sp.]